MPKPVCGQCTEQAHHILMVVEMVQFHHVPCCQISTEAASRLL